MKQLILGVITIFTATIALAQEGTPDIIRGDEKFTLLVKTIDNESNANVNGAEVYLFSTKNDRLISSTETKNGLATFAIEPSTEYEIRTCHNAFMKNGISIYECNEGNEVLCTFGASEYNFVAGGGVDKPRAVLKATIALQPMKLGSIFELANVYYDLDKATLRPTGKSELDDLAKIMTRNKSIKIELSSHTDSRASESYNMDLSQRRARSCYDYLTSKGIAPERVTPRGYGESKLRNECSDGVECSEEKHQKNRRTEIEILAYEAIACAPSKDMDFKNKDLVIDPDDKK